MLWVCWFSFELLLTHAGKRHCIRLTRLAITLYSCCLVSATTSRACIALEMYAACRGRSLSYADDDDGDGIVRSCCPEQKQARVYSAASISLPIPPLGSWGAPGRRELPRGREARIYDPGLLGAACSPWISLGSWKIPGLTACKPWDWAVPDHPKNAAMRVR